MDPQTLDIVVNGIKVGGFLIFGSGLTVGAILGTVVCYDKYLTQKYLVELLMPAYAAGKIRPKPALFNIYQIVKE